MIACVTGFHPKRFEAALVPVRIVIVVMILDRGTWRVESAVSVGVGRRTVLMFRMCVTCVRMYVLGRGSRQSGHSQRERERQEAAHEDESTTSSRTSVKSRVSPRPECGSAGLLHEAMLLALLALLMNSTLAGWQGQQPRLAHRGDAVFLAFVRDNTIQVVRSTDGGQGFDEPTPIALRSKAPSRGAHTQSHGRIQEI